MIDDWLDCIRNVIGLEHAAYTLQRNYYAGMFELALINATNNALGTWIDLGTGRALPKYIPEILATGGHEPCGGGCAAARSQSLEHIVVIGHLADLSSVRTTIAQVGEFYGAQSSFPGRPATRTVMRRL